MQEPEDLACLGSRLTPPDLQCQVLRMERLEGTLPPGFPRLVGVSFVTQTRLPRYVRVGNTSCVLGVSPKLVVRSGVIGVTTTNARPRTFELGAPDDITEGFATVDTNNVQTVAPKTLSPTGIAFPGRRRKSL